MFLLIVSELKWGSFSKQQPNNLHDTLDIDRFPSTNPKYNQDEKHVHNRNCGTKQSHHQPRMPQDK